MRKPVSRFFIVLTPIVGLTFATLLPLCNRMFSCGCNLTGAEHCNIHHVAGPRCPWCDHGNGVFALAYGLILNGIVGSIILVMRCEPLKGRPASAFAAGIAGYLLTASAVGLAMARYFHYPTWYGIALH